MDDEERLQAELVILGFVEQKLDRSLYSFRKFALIRENRHQINVNLWPHIAEVVLPNLPVPDGEYVLKSRAYKEWSREVLKLVELAMEGKANEW